MASGGWSSLPIDLLKEVSSHLCSTPTTSTSTRIHNPQRPDCAGLPELNSETFSSNFQCKWPNIIRAIVHRWRAAVFRPWVLAGSAWWCGLVQIRDCSLRLPRRGAPRLDAGDPPAGLPYCCGTSFGWLALVDDQRFPTRLVLWDPNSNTQIPLPCLSPLSRSNWAAIATQLKGLIGQTALVWRPGDAAWTIMYENGTYEIKAMTFHDGKAYYIDCEKNIIICDLGTRTDLPPKITRIYHVQTVVNKLRGLHPVCGVHLVACNGDLLLVVLRARSSGHRVWAEVYKPEWTSSETYPGVLLRERVMDLGDYSLFLGACGFYYANKSYYDNWYWISVFHLESNVLAEIRYPEPEELKQDEANWRPYAWFCPRARAPFHKQQ
ncbi:hypothetical protein GQ55_4G315600 [Panicum hallii var. hallii]|uniref:KIB1-4 beta-propeller domain-containing protein n=1 Tax=Panicum hallii var. hallii TaxID=1504633 RepID=A0A2T7E229_9POAL|nr:hypothetical protein GQ55_4G315600 [Panicum hallii var. hallii]